MVTNRSPMKKYLITFVLLLLSIVVYSQEYRYWMSQEVEASGPLVKNQRVVIYKKRISGTSYIKMVNKSCFDARYAIKIGFSSSRRGKSRYFIERSGIIEKGETLYFKKNVSGTSYIRLHDYDYSVDYDDGLDGMGGPKRVSYFYPAQEKKIWSNDIVVLKCLGYKSNDDFVTKERAETKRLADAAMESFREEMRLKKIADEKKLRAYLDKGLAYHIRNYDQKKKDGFYYGVPMDSLEMIARYKGQYMIIVNVGPGYRSGMFELDQDTEAFLNNQVVTGLSSARDRSFYKWTNQKSIEIKYTPAVIILGPDGQLLHKQSLNTTELKNGFATWARGISQLLEVSPDN